MEIWRVTFTENQEIQNEVFTSEFKEKEVIKGHYTELRNFNGELMRLGKNSDFSLEKTVLGLRPVIDGEVYLKMHPTKGPHKYRTSCWTMPILEEYMESFYKKINEDRDEIFALKGTQIVYEFDKDNKPFVIGIIEEGQKLNLKIDNTTKDIRKRYDPTVSKIKDEEYEYILENFIDNRKWIN